MRDQRGQGWRRGCSAVCGESRVQGDPAGHPPLTAYTPPSYSQPACPSGLAPPGPGEHWERWERTRLPQPWGLLPRVLRTKERLHPGRGGGSFPLPVGPAQLRPPPGSGLLVHSRAEQPVSYAVVSQERSHPLQSSGSLRPGKKCHSWGLSPGRSPGGGSTRVWAGGGPGTRG